MARRALDRIDATAYRPIIDYIVTNLNLQDVTIKYQFKKLPKYDGMSSYKTRKNIHVIEINTLVPDERIRFVIAHELRHVWQKETKILSWRRVKDSWVWFWDGVQNIPMNETNALFRDDTNDFKNYKALPWETDANNYANGVLTDLKLIPTRS